MKTVLIVDDERKVRDICTESLTHLELNVLEASSSREAINILIRQRVDLILMDIKMPEIDGRTLYEAIRQYDEKVDVMVASVYPVDEQMRLVEGAVGYFDKAEGTEAFVEKVKRLIQK